MDDRDGTHSAPGTHSPGDAPVAGLSAEASVDLLRQLRDSAQLQHAWVTALWRAEPDLHPAAAMALADLDKHGESRPSELARRRMVDLSVVSRQLSQLAAAGLIERRPAPEDGRATLVRVSELGEHKLEWWRGLHVEFVRDALRHWDEDGLRALTARLTEVNGDLRAALTGAQPVLQEAAPVPR